jgi:hypothetical protein
MLLLSSITKLSPPPNGKGTSTIVAANADVTNRHTMTNIFIQLLQWFYCCGSRAPTVEREHLPPSMVILKDINTKQVPVLNSILSSASSLQISNSLNSARHSEQPRKTSNIELL